MRTILLGQAPARAGSWRRPLADPPVGTRLASLAGLGVDDYLRAFDRRNLLPRYPGRDGKGDAFPLPRARRRANLFQNAWRRSEGDAMRLSVVLMGRNVARAFEVRTDYFVWLDFGHYRLAVFPHPSGINRFWNDPRNVRRAARFLRKAAR